MRDLFGHTPVQQRGYIPCPTTQGDDEWYTPGHVIEVARETMNGIDLDPASSPEANTLVQAKRFFTKEDNGMLHQWAGRVFLNPPFTGTTEYNNKKAFIAKLAQHYAQGEITQACLVCPIDFSPSWGQPIRDHATAICPSIGHYKYWKPADWNAKPQGLGSMLAYFGQNIDAFATACLKYRIGQPYAQMKGK